MCNQKNMFNSNNMTCDLSNDVDNIINEMVDDNCDNKIVKCMVCDEEDINNEYNFKGCCYNCNNKICLSCFKENKEVDGALHDYIVNYEEDEEGNSMDEDEMLCVDCGICCENCEEYTDEWSAYPLLNIEGDWITTCRGCIIEEGMDMCRLVNGKWIRYIKQEFIPNCSEDYVNCADCGLDNFDLEYIGDEDSDNEKYEDMDDDEKCETGDFERVLNDETFYNYYDEEEEVVCVCCPDCCETGLRY